MESVKSASVRKKMGRQDLIQIWGGVLGSGLFVFCLFLKGVKSVSKFMFLQMDIWFF